MPGISIGTQLIAPSGYKCLEQGITYYFLRNSAQTGCVRLINFIIRDARVVHHQSATRPTRKIKLVPFPQITVISRDDFESGLGSHICRAPVQNTMPPWLSSKEGLNLALLDSERRNPKRSHMDRIDRQIENIKYLVDNFEELLDFEDPDSIINQHARALQPRQNETRLRLSFYTYVLFGRNRYALHYSSQDIGKWSRERHSDVKRGRPPLKGNHFGFNSTKEMIEKMVNGYRDGSRLGENRNEIYIYALRKEFGCKTRRVVNERRKTLEIYHPQGKPFPEKGAFYYHVEKHLGTERIKEALWGPKKLRSNIDPTVGPFTEQTWNLMQRVEADAYAVKALARGFIEGNPLKPLYVTTKRDTTSGIKTGIGFTQGGERSSGYRMATFCEAVPKPRLCKLFGIDIEEWQWPSVGVAPYDIRDRGPGSTSDARSRTEVYNAVINGMSPSNAGQSKAVVESSHPKTLSNDEAPSFFASNMRTFELVRREILELLRFNESQFAASRIPPELADKVSRNSPNGIWETLDSLGRNDAVQMNFDDAVRAYLDKVDALLTRDGIVVHGQLYKSTALTKSGARSAVSGDQRIGVKVYVLEACLRHVWLEWHGQLIEVDLTFAVPVNDDVKYMSLEEMLQLKTFTDEQQREHKKHQTAVNMQMKDECEKNVGKEWKAGTRMPGRPKRGTKVAKQEAAEAKAATQGRRVA